MSEMVKRLAWAMREASDHSGLELTFDDCEPLARAVVKAMREAPDCLDTPKVLLAGKKALFSCSEDPELEDARKCWHAMIDEALK